MAFMFKPKYPRIEDAEKDKEQAAPEAEEQKQEAQPQAMAAGAGGPSTAALSADIMKLKAQFEQFAELRKLINERFTRINEQNGELRGMIMDTNRTIQEMEVKTVKAVDLVEAVHPDKLMVDVRKQDAKIESLKAGIESNDSIMKSLMEQLKELRHQLSTFRGIEQVVELNEEVKRDLMNIKKVQAVVERHSDKIEGIFIESQKRFQEFESLSDKFKEVQKQISSVQEIADQNKVKLSALSSKKEVEDLISKFNNFEKHVSNIIDLLTKRANDLPKEIDDRFRRLEASMNDAFDKKIKKAEAMNKLLERIEKEAPRIAKEFEISEKLKSIEVKKIESQPSEETKETTEKVEEEKKGFFAKLLGGGKKKEEKAEGGEEKKE